MIISNGPAREMNKSGRVACPRFRNCGGKPLFLTCSLLLAVLCSVSVSAQSTRKPRPKQAPAQTQEAEFERFVKEADEARAAERFDEAISLYGKALNIKPKWPDGWWYIGAIFYQKDLYQQARDAFQNLVALEPERGPASAMLGLCLFQTGDYERAAIALQRARTSGVNDNSELARVVRYHTALLTSISSISRVLTTFSMSLCGRARRVRKLSKRLD